MEGISISVLLEIFKSFGFAGIIVVIWWIDSKAIKKIMDQYQSDMKEVRQMYKNNVHLVENYESLARDLKDVVIMNTQAMTGLAKDIQENQYCPMVRLEKRAQGVIYE